MATPQSAPALTPPPSTAPAEIPSGHGDRPAPLILPILTMGFATAVAMWIVGYATHFPGIVTPPAVVAALFALVQLAAGIAAARLILRRPILTAAAAGLVTSLINLMIIGSIIGSNDDPNALRAGWLVMVLGTLAFGPTLNALAATATLRLTPLAGPTTAIPTDTRQIWLARFAIVAALSAIPVLFSGGLVTSTASGLSVPDWPASYDAMMFLFPLQDMTGGIYYEHAHRLFGSLVGFTVMAFMAIALLWEPRRWMKALAIAAFVLVVAQGILGGVRVTAATDPKPRDLVMAPDGTMVERWTLPAEGVPHNYAAAVDHEGSLTLAMVHGVSGQLTFAFLCVLACAMALRWIRLDERRTPPPLHDPALRFFAFLLPAALLLQLTLGAGLRHFGHVGFLHSHIAGSVLVVLAAAFAGLRAASRRDKAFGPIPRLGTIIVALVAFQFALGWLTMFLVMPYDENPDPLPAIAMATVHQVTGAALLGCAAMLAAWSWRLVAAKVPQELPQAVPATS